MSSDKITAIFEGGIATVSYQANNRKRSKSVPADALCKAILAGTNTGKQLTFLPPGLRFHGRCGDKIIVGYEFPERVGKIPFRGQNREEPIMLDSVWPWGMTFIEFTDTPGGLQWNTFFQFGLKGPVMSLDAMMYTWPGSNVFGGHNCCIGDISIPKLQGVEQTGGLPFIFYNGISNGDLSANRFSPFTPEGGARIARPFELFKYLEVKEGQAPKQFPYDIMKNAKTVKSFLSERGYI